MEMILMAMPKFDAEKEEIVKEAREMMRRNKDNGDILEALESQYSEDFSESDLKQLIAVAAR